VLGGRKAPCVPKDYLPEYRRRYGRPCPRVQLAAENNEAARLARSLLSERTTPLVSAYTAAIAADHGQEAMLTLLDRAKVAVFSKRVQEAYERLVKERRGS